MLQEECCGIRYTLLERPKHDIQDDDEIEIPFPKAHCVTDVRGPVKAEWEIRRCGSQASLLKATS